MRIGFHGREQQVLPKEKGRELLVVAKATCAFRDPQSILCKLMISISFFHCYRFFCSVLEQQILVWL